MKQLIDKLEQEHTLSKEEFIQLLTEFTPDISDYLFEKALCIKQKYYGDKIFIRGLIEFTNYCRNDCLYCGIRRSNKAADRYRLSMEEIFACCKEGYELGFRTYVLQGGEDSYFDDEKMEYIVRSIKKDYPDCAITLSLGERSYESYKRLFEAGADRYLLRHETANEGHYQKIHPPELKLSNRIQCLYQLKEIGYQVGTGFMVGSPYQTPECLAEDLLFIKEFQPQMVGIGPFLPQKETPFGEMAPGTTELTLFILGLLRLMFPKLLIPATTALGTSDPRGREKGILAGANVIMPNLSPVGVRDKYLLYDNKICTGEESAQCKGCLERRMQSVGARICVDRGDPVEWAM